MLQFLGLWELGKRRVEGPEWLVAGLSSNLEHETIREAERWTRDEVSESGLDDVGVLEDESVVLKQHLN